MQEQLGKLVRAERGNLFLPVGVDCGKDSRNVVHLSDHAGVYAGPVPR